MQQYRCKQKSKHLYGIPLIQGPHVPVSTFGLQGLSAGEPSETLKEG
jgi:hypothetical protein